MEAVLLIPSVNNPASMDYPPLHPPAFNLDPPLTIFQKSQHLNPRISKGDSHYVNVYDWANVSIMKYYG